MSCPASAPGPPAAGSVAGQVIPRRIESMAQAPLCSRCGLNPRRPKQRWCGACHLAYKKAARASHMGNAGTRHEEVNVGEGLVKSDETVVCSGQRAVDGGREAPPPPAPYVPFIGTHEPDEAWCSAFLSDLAINGGMSLAAAAAGVHRSRVYRRMEDDQAFAEEVEVAKAYYRDLLEWESVNLARRKNNPLPYFARLKAELPNRYIDRQALIVATNQELDPADGDRILRAMLGHGPKSTLSLPVNSAPSAGPEIGEGAAEG